jgi:hypothetical protein
MNRANGVEYIALDDTREQILRQAVFRTQRT